MALKVVYGERAVADLIKSAGGRWNRSQRVWELAYKEVVALGLIDRMVTRDGDNATIR